jgi:hypothetical protein
MDVEDGPVHTMNRTGTKIKLFYHAKRRRKIELYLNRRRPGEILWLALPLRLISEHL